MRLPRIKTSKDAIPDFENGVPQAMSEPARPGVLIVSVDVDGADLRGDLNMQRALNSTSVALLGILGNHGVAGTWAMCDPAHSLMTERLLADVLPHELALLGEASWAAPTMGRVRFSRELAERVHEANLQGLKLETLAVRASVSAHYDLLVKSGLSVLRSATPELRRGAWWPGVTRAPLPCAAQALRWGLWQVKTTWRNFEGGLMASRRGIDRSASSGGLITWVLDGPRLVEGGASLLRMVDRVLGYAARRRDEGRLQIATVHGFVDGQLRRRATIPSDSILRARAA